METRMKAVRRAKGLTQASLAHLSGVSTPEISRIESGRLIPTERQREKLAGPLGLDPIELQVDAEQEAQCAG